MFLARLTMAAQFQTVAALSPLMIDRYGLSLADLGLLIGLYLAPGIVIALPGGAIAARFGDKNVVIGGMILMILGGLLTTLPPDTLAFGAGRLIAGTGGVILNVVMTKMLVDWFAGHEIATAMAIFVNSWPVGIAVTLAGLPLIAASFGLTTAMIAVLALIAACLVLFALAYHPPDTAAAAAVELKATSFPLLPLTLAGLIWAFYNTALAMVFSFGPALLVAAGWSVAHAGTAISGFMIVFSLALPFGGIIADRTGRRDMMMVISLVSFAALMPLALFASAIGVLMIFLVVGVLFALAAGPCMTLPSAVLPPQSRAFGMGVFFTIYYAVMMIAPRLAGALADARGDIGVTFLFGVALCLISLAALGLFRRLTASS